MQDSLRRLSPLPFAGAAFYVGFAEQPARLGLDDRALLKQWKPSYDRGLQMQASGAVISGVLSLIAAWLGAGLALDCRRCAHSRQLALYAVWHHADQPRALKAIAEQDAGAQSRALIVKWGGLHAVRTSCSGSRRRWPTCGHSIGEGIGGAFEAASLRSAIPEVLITFVSFS